MAKGFLRVFNAVSTEAEGGGGYLQMRVRYELINRGDCSLMFARYRCSNRKGFRT